MTDLQIIETKDQGLQVMFAKTILSALSTSYGIKRAERMSKGVRGDVIDKLSDNKDNLNFCMKVIHEVNKDLEQYKKLLLNEQLINIRAMSQLKESNDKIDQLEKVNDNLKKNI